MDTPGADRLDTRLSELEKSVSDLKHKLDSPKPKDSWDKLSALSTLISGVIIAAIGIWVNHSLVASQQAAQDAQATATRQIEEAHNKFQEQQAKDTQKLEEAREKAQEAQASAALQLQKEQSKSALNLQKQQSEANTNIQQIEVAEKFFVHLTEPNPKARTASLQLMETLNPKLAIILAINFSNSADPSLTNTIGKTLTNLRGSDNKEVQQLASNALQQFLAAKHIKEIINVIESGSKQPQYGALEANGPEDLSYGTTYLRISNGSLYTVLKTYCNSLQATQAKALTQYLPRLESGDKSLASDEAFKNALRAAATDLVMQEIQDQEFEGRYWNPTLSFVESAGLKLPLSRAVIYDTIINSGAGSVRRFAGEVQGPTPAQGADEKRWMSEFLVIRRNYFLTNLGPKFPKFLPGWLARVDLWLNFANRHNWNLEPPFTVQGVQFED